MPDKHASRENVFAHAPIVDVRWIANQIGITPGAVRRYLDSDGPEPRLIVDVIGLHEYTFTRERAEAWIAAYRAAPMVGRRGNGSARKRARK